MNGHTPEFLALYDSSYGRNYRSVPPDYTRCAAAVFGAWDTKQCLRANGHGPHGAYCKQHDPVARKAKQDAGAAKWRNDMENLRRESTFTSDCQSAIREIAAGHNDPRGLAQSIIDKLEKTK